MTHIARLPGAYARHWDWQFLGACREYGTELFFHPSGERGPAHDEREQAAVAVCRRCPVQVECLTHALAVREPYGVWGGLTEDERQRLLARRPQRRRPAGTRSRARRQEVA
ncbi:WhiB family transcriptional regulator [Kitasatospora sp. MMS16-BH015]|uniref:WhiB family transcriptional regulator n=1 Tax=Kitasatospora sp. MMS16-BH015 TaxID=2018025 RepID=UPI000CA12FCA|nr:WhiB family transcriptional regulator [Kitasatospora sp. MMS16-BH015]AUG81669.1 WhiB family transcriptional regulator [Kitasatospora sp. MMS16-BH015]